MIKNTQQNHKMRSIIFFLIGILFFTLTTSAQQAEPENTGLVKWMDLKTAQELNKKIPKPIFIDVYTDWCGWCKHMMKTTFSNSGLANYINAYFYPVRFNAETPDTVEFQDKKYINKNIGTRSPNDFAVILLEGKLSYPTIVFYNNNYKFKMLAPGYMSVKDLEPMLVYTVEYIFNTTQAQDYRKYYFKAFYPDSGFVNKDTISWLKSYGEAVQKNKIKKQKTLVFINTIWCNGGKTMLKSTFNNSIVTKFINDNFHTVYMDAQSQDSITYDDKVYKNTADNKSFHPFLHHLLGEQIVLPTILFFDEDMKYISHISQYLTPEALNPILQFFSGDNYKTETWDVFIKKYNENNK